MTLNVFNASELFRTTKNAESLNSRKKGVLLYNGQNLLDFDGKEDDYRGFGSSVVRKIFNEDERALYCFSPRRKFKTTRLRAPRNAEKAFKGD